MSPASLSGPKVLDGKKTAKEIRREVTEGCTALRASHGLVPGLTVVLVGEDPASQIYVRNKERAARKVGMNSNIVRLAADSNEEMVLETVRALNADASVHGILVQLPLPGGVGDQRVIETVDPAKDVDGFHPENAGRLFTGLPGFVPCTPAGVIELLKRNEIPLAGKHAVVIGRSNIVGKPISLLLQRANATVTMCHSRTQDLAGFCRSADILVAAAGNPRMVKGDWIRPGAAVMDVGVSEVDGKLVGDVDFDAAQGIAGFITPSRRGIGPMTITMLLRNTLTAYRARNGV